MARTSRKARNQPVEVHKPLTRVYKVAAYIRLSVEDDNKKTNNESLATQEALVKQYISKQMDMNLVGVYSDNGFTGTNFHRPDFERLMEEVRKRNIDCIVVKDLSRFGREYIETGYYLEKIFPFLGVRFISILENYDTAVNPDGNALMVAIKNIVNSYIPKEISQKVSSAHRQNQERGIIVTGKFPYGYKIDPMDKTKYVIDPITSPVVVDIFQWFIDGLTSFAVAKKLNLNKVPTPSSYKSEAFAPRITGERALWSVAMVNKILTNFSYTGNMAQRKTISSLYEGFGQTSVDMDSRIIVRGTHPAIISEENFGKAKEIQESRKLAYTQKLYNEPKPNNIFKGKLFCADCNHALVVSKVKLKSGGYNLFYHCPTYQYNDKNLENICSQKRVREDSLKNAVLNALKVQLSLIDSVEEQLEKYQQTDEYKALKQKQFHDFQKLERELNQNLLYTVKLFEHYTDNLVCEEEYLRLKQEYYDEYLNIESQLAILKEREEEMSFLQSIENKWVQAFRSCTEVTEINVDIVQLLLHKIVVSNRTDIEIFWNFSDDYQKTLAILEDSL